MSISKAIILFIFSTYFLLGGGKYLSAGEDNDAFQSSFILLANEQVPPSIMEEWKRGFPGFSGIKWGENIKNKSESGVVLVGGRELSASLIKDDKERLIMVVLIRDNNTIRHISNNTLENNFGEVSTRGKCTGWFPNDHTRICVQIRDGGQAIILVDGRVDGKFTSD